MQDMEPIENLRLQHLFEDSMATLTTAVETLSHQLTTEIQSLETIVHDVMNPQEDDGTATVRRGAVARTAVP
jgi:hypothetical protein